MPNYLAYRRSIRWFDPDRKQLFGDLMAIEMAPAGRSTSPLSSFGYFLPIWNGTQLGVDAAADYAFDETSTLVVVVRCPTHFIHLLIAPSQVTVEPWLPPHFVKIGAETILHYFRLNPQDLSAPYTGRLPPVLRMVAPSGCQPRPPGAAAAAPAPLPKP